jgi:hypothetical protein
MSSIGESPKPSEENTDPPLAFNHPGLCPTCRGMRINGHRPNQWGAFRSLATWGWEWRKTEPSSLKVVQANNGVTTWRTYRKRIAALREAHGRGCPLCGYPLKVIDGFLHHGSPCPDDWFLELLFIVPHRRVDPKEWRLRYATRSPYELSVNIAPPSSYLLEREGCRPETVSMSLPKAISKVATNIRFIRLILPGWELALSMLFCSTAGRALRLSPYSNIRVRKPSPVGVSARGGRLHRAQLLLGDNRHNSQSRISHHQRQTIQPADLASLLPRSRELSKTLSKSRARSASDTSGSTAFASSRTTRRIGNENP